MAIRKFVSVVCLCPIAAFVLCFSVVQGDDAWNTYPGREGAGHGKSVVLVSGDEEYRSEEALSQLGKILSTRHGFDCVVLYAIDEESGEIAPNEQENIPGLKALGTADLMVIATRFRNLPNEQMKEIDDYLRSGRPVIGMRTATHAFKVPKDSPMPITASTITGINRVGCRALVERFLEKHGSAIMDITSMKVHEVSSPRKQRNIQYFEESRMVTSGVQPTSMVYVCHYRRQYASGAWSGLRKYGSQFRASARRAKMERRICKNDPMMPVAWVKTYSIEVDLVVKFLQQRWVRQTDLVSEGVRRMIINACYWAVGLEMKSLKI